MTYRTARRVGGAGRRTRRVRRSSAGMTPARAGAALAMLICAGAVYGVAATEAFGFTTLRVEGESIVPEPAIRERLTLTQGQNLFQITTEPLENRVREIPAVESVDISIELPNTVVANVVERTPILVWQVDDRGFLVDTGGVLFAERPDPPPPVVAALPVVTDERAPSRSLGVTASLSPLDLDAATRLASLTPAQLGSAASGLAVSVTDANGFVVKAKPKGWTAVFGFYVLSIRTPDMIPGQVQVLTRLLAEHGESRVATAFLADERDGTFIPRDSPKPSATPKP